MRFCGEDILIEGEEGGGGEEKVEVFQRLGEPEGLSLLAFSFFYKKKFVSFLGACSWFDWG